MYKYLALALLLSVAFAGVELKNGSILDTIVASKPTRWGTWMGDLIFLIFFGLANAWCMLEGLFGAFKGDWLLGVQ